MAGSLHFVENNLIYGGFGNTAVRLAHQTIRVFNSGIRTVQSERVQAMGLVVPKLDKYFDPATVWPGVKQPTLAIFGSHDRHVLRGADHGMRSSESGFAAEPVPSEWVYAPGYFSAMTTWITKDFHLDEVIPGQLDEAEILAAADAEALRSPYASITNHFLTKVSLLLAMAPVGFDP